MVEQSSGRERLDGLRGARGESRKKSSFILFTFNLYPKSSTYEIPNTGLLNAAWQPSLLLDLC